MQRSSKLLALGLVLFLGACSVAEGKFLEKVSGKTMSDGTDDMGKFSSDGKTFGDATFAITFTEATDENTGIYSGKDGGTPISYTIKTTDGKTGTMTLKLDGAPSQNITLK